MPRPFAKCRQLAAIAAIAAHLDLAPRGVGKGDKRDMPAPEIPMLKKLGVLVNTLGLLQWLLAYYVFSFAGLRPQTPTRALPLDPAGGLLSPVPVLSPSETNFWLRPCFHRIGRQRRGRPVTRTKGYGLEDEQAATARSAVAACWLYTRSSVTIMTYIPCGKMFR